MTSRIEALQADIGNQLTQLKGCQWKVSQGNLGYYSVQIDKNKDILEGYRRSVSKTPSELHEGFGKSLEKMEKKIKSIEEAVEHLSSNSGDTDPRIKKLTSKVHSLNSGSPEIDKKIAKYIDRLLGLKAKDCNELLSVLQKLTISRLKNGHLVARCDLRNLNLINHFRALVESGLAPNCSNSNTLDVNWFTNWVQENRKQTSNQFLESMLLSSTSLEIHHPDFVKNLVEDGHKQVRKNHEASTSKPTLDKNENFISLSIGQEHQHLPNPTVDQLTSSLKAIMGTKQQMTLPNIAAIIHFQDKHLTLAIGPDNIIYLLNPHEDPRELHLVAYTDIKSAAELIHKIINKQNPGEVYSDILPYTSKDTPIEMLALCTSKIAQLCGVKNEQDTNTLLCELLSQNTQLLGENSDLFRTNNIQLGIALSKISDVSSKLNKLKPNETISSFATNYYDDVQLYGNVFKNNLKTAKSLHELSILLSKNTSLPPIETLRRITLTNANLLASSSEILETNDNIMDMLSDKSNLIDGYMELLSFRNSAFAGIFSELKKELSESIEPLRKNSQLVRKNLELLQKNSKQLSGNFEQIHQATPGININVVCSAKEHSRVEQRVQALALLHDLNSCLNGKGDVVPILNKLEALKFDSEDLPKDLPKDTKDFACALFGKIYHIYLAAWENNQTMVHPHDPCFHSDFGRNAFKGEARNEVPEKYKVLALQDLIKSIQDTWKV